MGKNKYLKRISNGEIDGNSMRHLHELVRKGKVKPADAAIALFYGEWVRARKRLCSLEQGFYPEERWVKSLLDKDERSGYVTREEIERAWRIGSKVQAEYSLERFQNGLYNQQDIEKIVKGVEKGYFSKGLVQKTFERKLFSDDVIVKTLPYLVEKGYVSRSDAFLALREYEKRHVQRIVEAFEDGFLLTQKEMSELKRAVDRGDLDSAKYLEINSKLKRSE